MALTTQIVSAFAAGNHLPATELPGLIRSVHAGLHGLASGSVEIATERHVLSPAEIHRSVQPDGLISFANGKAYKTLRRHLTRLGLTPEALQGQVGPAC